MTRSADSRVRLSARDWIGFVGILLTQTVLLYSRLAVVETKAEANTTRIDKVEKLVVQQFLEQRRERAQ